MHIVLKTINRTTYPDFTYDLECGRVVLNLGEGKTKRRFVMLELMGGGELVARYPDTGREKRARQPSPQQQPSSAQPSSAQPSQPFQRPFSPCPSQQQRTTPKSKLPHAEPPATPMRLSRADLTAGSSCVRLPRADPAMADCSYPWDGQIDPELTGQTVDGRVGLRLGSA